MYLSKCSPLRESQVVYIWKKNQTGSTDGWGKVWKGYESIIIAWYSKIIFPQLPSALFLKHPIKFRFQPHWIFSTVSSTEYFEDRYFHHISFCIRCLCSIKFAFLREVESHLHIHTRALMLWRKTCNILLHTRFYRKLPTYLYSLLWCRNRVQAHLYIIKHGTEGEGKVDATPQMSFDLCSDLILQIHSFVYPIPTAPWQM